MTPDRSDVESLLPLTPIAFDILLSLLDDAAHGYAIMRAVEARGSAPNGLHPGTLYRALSRLVRDGLIEEVDDPHEDGADERRRYYRVTSTGRRAAGAEARRLDEQLGAARALGLLNEA